MIDEQHPIQVGLFPLDIKCPTPQQLQLQQRQQQQQQLQQQPQPLHQQTSLLMNGNAGMLTATTPATIATTIASNATPRSGSNGKCGPTTTLPMTTTIATAGTGTGTGAGSSTGTPTTTTAITTTPTIGQQGPTSASTQERQERMHATMPDTLTINVNGSCKNSNSNIIANNNNSIIISDKSNISGNGDGLGLGPGPPAPPPPPSSSSSSTASSTSPLSPILNRPRSLAGGISAANTLTTISGCLMLGPCNSNVDNKGGQALCNINANTNSNINHSNNCGNATLAALHMQQQQQQQRLHMQSMDTIQQHHHLHQPQHHGLHHHHHHPHYHPTLASVMASSNNNNTNSNSNNNSNNNNNNCNSLAVGDVLSTLQLQLPCGIVNRLSGELGGIVDNAIGHHNIIGSSSAGGGGVGGVNGPGGGIAVGICTGNGLSLAQCGYCCQPICDRYIMRVVDTSFHESCLKCATCSLHLVHSCFARDGKLYCRIDYERLFLRNRCLGCGHKIASDELVMRTLENVFHLKCFACVVCGALLKKGEQYVVKQGQLFCRFDYEKEVEMLQGYDFYGDDLFPPKLDGRRGPKRPRTILNTQQRRAFKASFEVSPKPCRKVRENLAKETGLSLRIVQVWFQNQRAKVKKIQKKAKQEHAKGASDSQDSQESDGSLAKIKDEAHSDSESLLESPYSSCGGGIGSGGGGGGGGGGGSGGGSGGNIGNVANLPLNGAASAETLSKLRCIKDENENAPFNCMETNKENCNKTNEPILNTILGISYATFQQLMGPLTQSPMINPIDRLYSMQNSYFRPEELNYAECGKEIADN